MNNEISNETTTETTSTEGAVEAKPAKAPKAPKAPKASYPFRSKASILEQVASDEPFMLHCLGVMYDRQTASEQEAKNTTAKNKAGFMSSHAVNGSVLAVKARGEGLTAEETEKARSIVVRYGKQLASHFRSQALEADPTLAATAAIFGV